MKSRMINEKPVRFLLVFDRGDEIVATLSAFARDNAVPGAMFTAIGACSRATIAYWNAETKEYEELEVSEQVEIVSLSGSIATVDGSPRVHAHIALGKRDGSLIGGHLLTAIVYPTLELFLVPSEATLKRRLDDETGLMLIDLA